MPHGIKTQLAREFGVSYDTILDAIKSIEAYPEPEPPLRPDPRFRWGQERARRSQRITVRLPDELFQRLSFLQSLAALTADLHRSFNQLEAVFQQEFGRLEAGFDGLWKETERCALIVVASEDENSRTETEHGREYAPECINVSLNIDTHRLIGAGASRWRDL
jgi:hypothetical protein